jgi:hypothetical protein
MAWSKWSFWLVHALLAMLCYAAIVLLPFAPPGWRELLPAKASFFSYAVCLLGLYMVCAVGAILVGSKVVGGYCVYVPSRKNVQKMSRHAKLVSVKLL